MAKINIKSLLILGLLLIIALIFWNSFIIYPFRLLVVLMHECGHALAALLTGGKVIAVKISPNEGGVAVTQGGIRFIILSAGYLGSAIFGSLILYLSFKKIRKVLLGVMGGLILLVVIFYVRDLFTLLYSLASAAILIAIAVKASETFGFYFLQFLGITSSLYAIFDIRSDLIRLQQNPVSDAAKLAEITFIPGVVWGIIWAGISTFLIYKVMVTVSKHD